MYIDENLNKILSDFLNNASEEDRREFFYLLKGLKKKKAGIAGAEDFAGKISRQIHAQIGLTGENIKKTAVELVRRLARQHKPDITQRELQALAAQMVPSAKIPPELLKSMIMNYVLFMSGRMSEKEAAGFPLGWQDKFWKFFPAGIKTAVSDFLSKKNSPEEFWRRIKRITG